MLDSVGNIKINPTTISTDEANTVPHIGTVAKKYFAVVLESKNKNQRYFVFDNKGNCMVNNRDIIDQSVDNLSFCILSNDNFIVSYRYKWIILDYKHTKINSKIWRPYFKLK